MIDMQRKDDFSGRFDFFKWSAPIFENPLEVMQGMDALHLKGKKFQAIAVIGTAELPDTQDATRILYHAGMDLEKVNADNYENLRQVMLPCQANAWEPLQILFTDGTTLDFLPMEDGGARLAANTIPLGLTEGLNHSNFDAQTLFGEELAGAAFCELRIEIRKKTTVTFSPYMFEKENPAPYEELCTKYCYILDFDGNCRLEIETNPYNDQYTLSLRGCGYSDAIPYSKILASQKQIRQIEIFPGRASGGAMWIIPYRRGDDGKASLFRNANRGISMYDDSCFEFLGQFLTCYFDPSIQDKDAWGDGFDSYGENYYSYGTMQEMLSGIRVIADLFETDYDNSLLKPVKKLINPITLDERAFAPLAGNEKDALLRKNVPMIVDFYHRFAEHMETLMREFPECDLVVFSGP